MTDSTTEHKVNDILVDYEAFCWQIDDILEVMELARLEPEKAVTNAIINTVYHALHRLTTEHKETAKKYRKELLT